jgi:hypothetical protein
MAYALACEALQQEPTVQPGDTIGNAELSQVVEVAADAIPAGPLVRQLRRFAIGVAQMEGPWHTLPDLLSFLATPQFSGGSDASSKEESVLSGLAPSIGRTLFGKVLDVLDPDDQTVKAGFVELLVDSCTLPREPIAKDKMELPPLFLASAAKG